MTDFFDRFFFDRSINDIDEEKKLCLLLIMHYYEKDRKPTGKFKISSSMANIVQYRGHGLPVSLKFNNRQSSGGSFSKRKICTINYH